MESDGQCFKWIKSTYELIEKSPILKMVTFIFMFHKAQVQHWKEGGMEKTILQTHKSSDWYTNTDKRNAHFETEKWLWTSTFEQVMGNENYGSQEWVHVLSIIRGGNTLILQEKELISSPTETSVGRNRRGGIHMKFFANFDVC